jgi:hypothetical protein
MLFCDEDVVLDMPLEMICPSPIHQIIERWIGSVMDDLPLEKADVVDQYGNLSERGQILRDAIQFLDDGRVSQIGAG